MKQNLALSCSIKDIVPLLNLCLTEDRLNEIIISNQENIPLLHISLKVKYYYVLKRQQQKLAFPLYNILKKITKSNFDDVCAILELSMLVQNMENVTLSIVQYLQEIRIKLKDIEVILKLLYTITNIYYFYKLKLPCCLNESLIQSLYVEAYNSSSKSLQNLFCRFLIKYVSDTTNASGVLHLILSFNDIYTISCCSHIFMQYTHVTDSDRFWLMITDNIKSSGYNRKLSLQILKNYIHYNSKHNSAQLDIIKGNTRSSAEFTKCWNDYFTLMEITQEKSLHLIVPALALIANVAVLHSSWIICLYKVLLSHTQNAVVFFVANSILETNITDSDEIFESVIQCLLPALNKHEYSDNFFKVFKKMKELSKQLNNEQFSILLKESLKITWSPVPAWYFYSSILVDEDKCEIDCFLIINAFNQIKSLSYPFIRHNCQILLLQFLIKQNQFTNCNINEFVTLAIDLKKSNPKLLLLFYQYAERNVQVYNRNKDILEKINSISRYSADEVQIILQIADYSKENVSAVENALSPEIIHHEAADCLISYLYKCDSKKLNIFDYLEQKLLTKYCNTNDYALYNIAKYVKIDNANSTLLEQCKVILSNPDMFEEYNIILAFEIYSSNVDRNLENVVKLWNKKFLKGGKIGTKICKSYFRIYFKYLENIREPFSSFEEILETIIIVFDTHSEDVWLDVYENVNIILNRVKKDNILLPLLDKLLKELINIKSSENLVRAWAPFIKTILSSDVLAKDDIKDLIVSRIFELTLINETSSYIFVNEIVNAPSNIALLFIDLIVHLVLHGGITKKDKRCEFYACREIDRVLNIQNKSNSNYVHTNIRSVAINTICRILNENGQDAGNLITAKCLEKYRQHFKKRYFPDSEIHLSKLRIIQVLFILRPHISDDLKTSIIDLIIESFCEESHQPCVKQLMQWLLVLLLKDDHKQLQKIFCRMARTSRTHTSTIAAFVSVLCHIGFNSNEEFIENIIQVLLEWTMGAHFKLRVYSQVGICKLIETSVQKKYNLVVCKYDAFYKSIQQVLKMAGASVDNILQTDKVFLDHVDVNRHYNLHSIYIAVPRLNNVLETEWEYIDLQLFYHCKTIPITGCVIDAANVIRKKGVASDNITVDYSVNNIQKKILPTVESITVDENEEKRYHTELILVATLVDSAANLGGIARTCEIYGVKKLVVSDCKIISDKEFKSLSMSSEHWLNVSEVKLDGLEDYFQRAKEEGYTVVGLEQTVDSVKLHNYNFPRKCILVLGNEKEGIPSRIFPYLDACIEIPQFGLLRSLNVHVAGAITVWEYVRQYTLL